MDSLVGYGSEDDVDERYDRESRGGGGGGAHRREDDTNYDDVTMDMSEDSNNNESDRELPQATDRDRRHPPSRSHGKEKSPSPRRDHRSDVREKDRHERRDHHEKSSRSERGRRNGSSSPSSSSSSGRRGHDKSERKADPQRVPSLMDLKPFGGEKPPSSLSRSEHRDRDRDRDSRDLRDGRSERDRREPERERRRDRESHAPRDKERRSDDRRYKRRSRSRSRSRSRRSSREAAPHGPREKSAEHTAFSSRAPSGAPAAAGPSADYRPSYKVSKKLQVMEKMGLQIKTPDGSMATAQELMQRTVAEQHAPPSDLPSYYNTGAVNASKLVQKRKLLWGKKEAAPQPTPPPAAVQWTSTRFAQDADGRVASKFMRLMGIRDPEAVKPPPDVKPEVDVNRKQQEMFEAMQAQYDVARATTHTMRGVGLGFQRHL